MKQKIFYLSLVAISLLSSIGALVYRFYSFNIIGVILSFALTILGFVFLKKYFEKINYSVVDIEKKYTKFGFNINRVNLILITFYLLLFTISLMLLLMARMDESIISPWQKVSFAFFISYTLATISLFLIAFKKIGNTIILIMAHSFLSFFVLIIVFKIGYGYDPFIHQATLELIKEKGVVDPKPFYYLGQYSLVFLIHRISFIPISVLDKLLVPTFSAIFLPGAIYLFFKKNFCEVMSAGEAKKNESILLLSVLLFFLLPFSYFTLTNPQNLAFLFLILTIFFGLISTHKRELILSCLLAITTFLIHPIAGIGAILFLLFLIIYNLPYHKFKKIIYIAIFFITVFSLPAAFLIAENFTPLANTINEKSSETVIKSNIFSTISVPDNSNIFLNFIYLFKNNYSILLIILIIFSFVIAYRKKARNRKLAICASFSICFFIGYFLTSQLNFNSLIDYERQNYSLRVLTIAIIFLLPIFGYLFYKLVSKIYLKNNFIRIGFLVFFSLLITTSLYINYPRVDDYFNSRSFSVGKYDIEAVNWIESDAQGADYVVLANQQVSVAALWQFGFNRYLEDDNYFYPIPTGGILYKHYLDMVYDRPSRKTMESAMEITGVNKGYFIINKYWWAFDKIIKEAKMEANSFVEIANGELFIFKYKSTP